MKILPLFLSALTVLTFSSEAAACVCDTLAGPEKAFTESVAVFTGKYLGAEYRGGIKNEMVERQFEYDGKRQDYQVLVQRFRVTDWFKGGSTTEAFLVTDQARMADGTESMSDCGLGFEVGRSYLIYAYGDEKEYGTGACTRTRRLSRAGSDLAVLKRLAREQGAPTLYIREEVEALAERLANQGQRRSVKLRLSRDCPTELI